MISKFSHFFKQYTLETIFYYFMSFLIISLLLIINLLALYPTTFNKALQYFHYKLCGWHTSPFVLSTVFCGQVLISHSLALNHSNMS